MATMMYDVLVAPLQDDREVPSLVRIDGIFGGITYMPINVVVLDTRVGYGVVVGLFGFGGTNESFILFHMAILRIIRFGKVFCNIGAYEGW